MQPQTFPDLQLFLFLPDFRVIFLKNIIKKAQASISKSGRATEKAEGSFCRRQLAGNAAMRPASSHKPASGLP
jgi:hypothetical protein